MKDANTHVLEQYKRIYTYLFIAGQERLCTALARDWRNAQTKAQRAGVIARWLRSIDDSSILLLNEESDDA